MNPWCRPTRRARARLQAPVAGAVEVAEDAILVSEHLSKSPHFVAHLPEGHRERGAEPERPHDRGLAIGRFSDHDWFEHDGEMSFTPSTMELDDG
jgi:hypothetical protein